MKLSQIVHRYNTQEATDSYGTDTFMVQFEPLSFSKIDGVAVKKRQITVLPNVTVPTRGAITIDGQVYLVGHGAPDYFKGETIRVTLIIQGADSLANLTTIADALANTAPTQAYATLVFSKYMPESNDNSKYPPQYQVFLAGSEVAPADSLIQIDTRWFLVKQSYISTSGLRVALANELDQPTFETISFGAQTYDPLTDTYTGSTSSVKILRVKWSEHFTYMSLGSETYQRGDMQVFMPKSVTPKVSDTLTLSDGTWRILAVQNEATWSCHVRRS